MPPPVPPQTFDQAIASVENIVQNPRPFSTAEIIAEIRTLLSLLQVILKGLPQEQQDHLAEVRHAMEAGDRKRLLREVPDAIDICKDAWQTARLQYYNEVKRYLKFIHENRRTPTLEECRVLKLMPSKLPQYMVDLDWFLREGEGPNDFGPADDSEQPGNRDEFIAKAGERVLTEWELTKRPVSIPTLVIEGGFSFADTIAIVQWVKEHADTPDIIIESRIADIIAHGTTEALQSHQCPVCRHQLPPFPTGETSIICEGCGFEIKKQE